MSTKPILQTTADLASSQTAGAPSNFRAGDTSGVAVPAGFVGEVVNTSLGLTDGALIITTLTNIGNGSLSLTAGNWEIVYDINVTIVNGLTNSAPNFNDTTAWFMIAQAGVEVDNSRRTYFNREVGVSAVNAICASQLKVSAFINISSTTVYTLQGAYTTGGSGSGSAALNNSGNAKSRFYARRIA